MKSRVLAGSLVIIVGFVLGASWIFWHRSATNTNIHINRMPNLNGELANERVHAISTDFEHHNQSHNQSHRDEKGTLDRGFIENHYAQEQANGQLEEMLGHRELQDNLKLALRKLSIERSLPEYANLNDVAWHQHVSRSLAPLLKETPQRIDAMWFDIEQAQASDNSMYALEKKYHDFNHVVWDLYIQRNSLSLIYQHETNDEILSETQMLERMDNE
jgi:hypothetical protein